MLPAALRAYGIAVFCISSMQRSHCQANSNGMKRPNKIYIRSNSVLESAPVSSWEKKLGRFEAKETGLVRGGQDYFVLQGIEIEGGRVRDRLPVKQIGALLEDEAGRRHKP